MSSKTSTHAPKVNSPADLRNVVLVGSAGSGKTTLFENLIKARIPGYRGEKDDPERLAVLAMATLTNGNTVINLFDAPGNPDYVGELRAGLRAADAALFVVSAADGIDMTTQILWNECASVGMPRAIVVTKLDTERASFEQTVQQCQEVFGAGVHPAYLPFIGEKDQIVGNLSLLSRKVHDYSSGSRTWRNADEGELAAIEDFRTAYVESIITESEDDELLERYFDGDELAVEEVVGNLMKALYHGSFHPVIPVTTSGVGTEELLGVIDRGFPTPLRWKAPTIATLDGDPVDADEISVDAPLLAEVIRTTSDPYAGRLSMVRVFNGTLRPDSTVHVTGRRVQFSGGNGPGDHDDDERVGLLTAPHGVELYPKDVAIAGEIVMVAKLGTAETSDTLSDPAALRVIEPWLLPEPLLPVAIRAASRNDEDKLAGALQRLVVEDSTVKLERAPGTEQLLLWTMGQAHQDLLMNRLKDRYGVNITADPIRAALRETFIKPATAHGRHVKQSGGHGQYAVCDIKVEPNERGAGFEFIDEVVGGAVPRQFIPSVEKGVRAQMEKGTLTGYPMVDIKVTLYDGKAHSVDSSDMAFQSAGALALKEAANPSTVALLEPLDEVRVTVNDEYLGAVMTDLSNRRGQVLGTDSSGSGQSTVQALVPQSELSRYAIDLRGLARGSGSFSRKFHGYEIMPTNLAQEYMKA
ncbi:MAG: elongation factor G-like protein EF-G2 [Acidobacteriota bacterium]|nr:elongation factor G-like protein EF-G2 [Acidobacteriota bacterium]